MKTTAAILVETGKPLDIAELEVPKLKPGQVLVQIAYSAVCHTQILEARGFRGEDKFLPHCLGHEGSGIVLEIGPHVTRVKPGEKVILSWMKGKGEDIPGSVYAWNGKSVNAGAITTFMTHAVMSENRLTPIRENIPMSEAAYLGCALPTGVGAVLNTAQAKPGNSLAVFGCGGIGLFAIAGGTLAGCSPIIALDIRPEKLILAREMGATHFLDASKGNSASEIAALCPNGLDLAVESTGRPQVMTLALSCVRPRGGKAIIVGNAPHGQKLEINPGELNQGKQLLGTWGGDNSPDSDFPRYGGFLAAKKLTVKPLMQKIYPLAGINEALDDLEKGICVRPLIDMGTVKEPS